MSGLDLKKELSLEDMQKGIKEAGGLFYQYRPCRRDMSTIYDIENIRHGVVYAQTPLNMNDPFDSMIGFSSEKIYENAISMIIDAVEGDDNVKATECNVDEEIDYVNFLFQQVNRLSELMKEASAIVVKGAEDKKIDSTAFQGMLEYIEDCLCNTYFIKTSLNRIAEHFIATHSDEGTPSNILDIVKTIEDFRTVVNNLVNQFPDSLITLKVFGVINLSDFNIANDRIKKIKELNESIEKYPWHPIYQN